MARSRTLIRPPSGWPGVDVREMWEFRDLLLTLAARDVKVRYKQTALGAVWVVLQPLLAAGIFAFVFGRVAALPAPGGMPYFLFAFAGLTAWTVFSTTLTRASTSVVGSSHLVSKIYFPRLLLPLSTAVVSVVDFAVVFALLLLLGALAWELPGAPLLIAPAVVLLLLLLALGIGFLTSALAVAYRDVAYVVPVAVQFLLFASPVVYDVETVPAQYLDWYYLNPLVSLLEVFRWSVLGVGDVRWSFFAYAAAVSVAVFVAGALLFRRIERAFADVI